MIDILHEILRTATAVIAVLVIRHFLFTLVLVKGSSMLDTLMNRDLLVMRRFGGFCRGDIVICHYPGRRSAHFPHLRTNFVKRIVALPGETVSIEGHAVRINGHLLSEPYLSEKRIRYIRDMEPVTLGSDEFFVLGDNRNASNDSRRVGPISRRMLRGVVICRLFPFHRCRSFTRSV